MKHLMHWKMAQIDILSESLAQRQIQMLSLSVIHDRFQWCSIICLCLKFSLKNTSMCLSDAHIFTSNATLNFNSDVYFRWTIPRNLFKRDIHFFNCFICFFMNFVSKCCSLSTFFQAEIPFDFYFKIDKRMRRGKNAIDHCIRLLKHFELLLVKHTVTHCKEGIRHLSYDRDFWLFVKNDARSKEIISAFFNIRISVNNFAV